MKGKATVGMTGSLFPGTMYCDGMQVRLQRGTGEPPLTMILLSLWLGLACGFFTYVPTRFVLDHAIALSVGLWTMVPTALVVLAILLAVRASASRRFPPLTLASVTAERESRVGIYRKTYRARVNDTTGQWWDIFANDPNVREAQALVAMLPSSGAAEPAPWVFGRMNEIEQSLVPEFVITRHDREALRLRDEQT